VENDLLRKHGKKFREIESLDTNNSLNIIEQFVEQLPGELPLKYQLTRNTLTPKSEIFAVEE